MKYPKLNCAYIFFLALALTLSPSSPAQTAGSYVYNGQGDPGKHYLESSFQFNGYTRYWHDTRDRWVSYGNLFKTALPDADFTIAQSKRDIADDLELPGLFLQEGFINTLLGTTFSVLDQPGIQALEKALSQGDVLVLTDPASETGKKLMSKVPPDKWKEKLRSHQLNAADFVPLNAFLLENGKRKLFVIASSSADSRNKLLGLINNTIELTAKYDLKKGWFGAATLLKSVTIAPGHPLEVIGRGLNEGASWFTFSGYMDYLLRNELETWMKKVNLPVATDVGAFVGYVPGISTQAIYGCTRFEELQPQNMYTVSSWLNFARSRHGYAFRSVYDPGSTLYEYDGYIATDGNKEQIDNENVPFIATTGYLEDDALSSMVLFTPKGQEMTRETMWSSILARKEVAITGTGKMMGPAEYRHPLGLLLLDRVFLEEYFGDRIALQAKISDYKLEVNIQNTYDQPVSGDLELGLPVEIKTGDPQMIHVSLPARASASYTFKLEPGLSAMGMTNPVAVHFTREGRKKSTLTMLDLPPVISVHQLLYGLAPAVRYPVSVHNFTTATEFPVNVEAIDKSSGKVVFTERRTLSASRGTYAATVIDLKLPAGKYDIKTTALGAVNTSQLGVGKAEGSPVLKITDLNNDGVNEYQLENDSVRITLLTTGARVIEYYVKSRNDNVLFKLWPGKPVDDKREYRKRNYYPFGGFEDFLGQASMETHKVYTAEVLQGEGNSISVRMTADYYGNKLEKTFTLYGSSPLLEVRYAFDFINPEANVIAPVPILVLGKKHGTEDIFTVPEKGILKEYRMQPETYVGQVIFPDEGWDAGYDPYEDISFAGAFPVSRPNFLHMFQNLATNGDAHYDFNEYQPWVPIIQKTTSYFSYYLWGAGGKWQNSVNELRDRNLISKRKETNQKIVK